MQKLLISFVGFYSVLLILVYLYQKNLLFFPDQTPLEDCPDVRMLGGSHYESKDRLVRLYQIRSQAPMPQGYVLHFHGNAGRACDRLGLNQEFLDLGYHLILAEYPGYSERADLPSEPEILKSAQATYEYINELNQENLPIVLFGESLGTGAATYLASQSPKNLKALILQTPFPSLADIGQSHYFYLPVKLLLKHQFKAKDWAKLVKVPVFIYHGNKDEVIPFRLGLEQSQNFSKELVTFWELGSHHNDIHAYAGRELWVRIKNFLSLKR